MLTLRPQERLGSHSTPASAYRKEKRSPAITPQTTGTPDSLLDGPRKEHCYQTFSCGWKGGETLLLLQVPTTVAP